jgi:hypothetical protein
MEAPDQQANVAPERRGHHPEVELDSPEGRHLRDGFMLNHKIGGESLPDQA